jgi:hypothetical protein
MAPAPSLHGRYPLLRYYGPVRLPTAAGRTVMFSRTAADAQAVALPRVSQVPRPFCPRALSPFAPEGPTGAHSRCFPAGGRLRHFRKIGHPHWCNEAGLGSLTLRLAGSPPEASPTALLRRTLGWLSVERAIDRVTSFHVTRTARLVLAHRQHEISKARTKSTHGP